MLCLENLVCDYLEMPDIHNLKQFRDVSNIGHFGAGNVEFTINSELDFDEIKQYIDLAYNKLGG